MKDFFKYLTAGEEDKVWGLYLNVAGKSKIDSNTTYPNRDHPTGYFFTWESGGILQEFQIIYVTEGSGILENEHRKYQIKTGTLMITKPGVWHRYKPLEKTGWIEHYIGFDGDYARKLFDNSIFPGKQSVIQCGNYEELIDTYYKIFDIVQKEEPGFQQVGAGLVLKLLGYIVAFQKQRNFAGTEIEKIIQKVRFYLRENIGENINMHELAESNHVGYSYFRKMFKKYTGVSPHQYYLDLKIMRAKELILTSKKSMKEIGLELGFQSIHYFSRLFKKKEGTNPTDLRRKK